jgi:DinB family protein
MNESERLAREIEKVLDGGAWHGPSWRETLDGVSRSSALLRPIAKGHTIAEIVLHATTWHDVVRQRLEGETPDVTAAQDWPVASFASDDAWSAATRQALQAGLSLCETIRRFPPARLHERRPGLEETWFELISGQLQHTLYHLGQIGILKKAAA